MKVIISLIGIFILIMLTFAFCAKQTYIDEFIEDGEAYGFKIGDSKNETYKKARAIFADQNVFILHPLDKKKFGPHVKFTFENDKYSILADRNSWDIYYDEGFYNSIKLEFQNEILVSIYRHRKKHELP